VQPHEAITILPQATTSLADLLPIATILLAGIFNWRAAHNMARTVRESLRQQRGGE